MVENTQMAVQQIQGNLRQISDQMKLLYTKLNLLAEQTENETTDFQLADIEFASQLCSLVESSMFSVQEAVESVEYADQCLTKIAL